MIVRPDKAPGHYPAQFDLRLRGESLVDTVAMSTNSAPPANSKYIGYDELDPPNPFLAVTQDGKGNVVYDGGFPKFYNTRSSAYGPGTPFSDLPAQLKFLWNAVNFIANKEKVASGNKKVLLLGDQTTDNYWVKSTASSGFKDTFTNVITTMGFDLTIKDANDYGGTIDITLSELEQYCCVIFMSSSYTSVPQITQAAINNFLTYRQNGSGLFFITDHGSVINDFDTAVNGNYSGFFRTANAIIVNFGAWFSGNYDRTSVNVGYLRNNYGDHPLYSGLSDAENISAGGSESEVVLASNDTYESDKIPPVTVNQDGVNTVNVLSVTKDGEVVSERYLYTVGNNPLVNVSTQGSIIPFGGEIHTYKKYADFDFISNYPELGTLVGEIYIDDVYLGTVNINGSNTSFKWITNPLTPVISGSDLKLEIVQPYRYTLNWTINQLQSGFSDARGKWRLFDTDFVRGKGLGLIRNINSHFAESIKPIFRPDTASVLDDLELYDSGNVDYGSIEVYLVDSFQEIFSSRQFSTTEKVTVVNVDTREVYLPTDNGWVLSDKSAGELLGVGRKLIDKYNRSTYTTTNQPKQDVNYPLQTPFWDDQKLFGYCSIVQSPWRSWFIPTEVLSAKWIWDRTSAGENAPVGEQVHLRKWFYSPYTGTATLKAGCDDSVGGIWINGQLVTSGGISHTLGEIFTINVRQGMNLIHADGRNSGGPAGFLAYILSKDGDVLTKTDSSWLKYSIPDKDTGAIHVTDGDDVKIPFNSDMVLTTSDAFEIELDIRTMGPVGGSLVSVHHAITSTNPDIHHGVVIHTKTGFSHIALGLNSGEGGSRINVATDMDHPSFINVFDNNWHTIKAVYDGSCDPDGLEIWIDGVKQSTYQFSEGFATSGMSLSPNMNLSVDGAPIRIGARGDSAGNPAFRFESGDYKNLKIKRNGIVIGYYPMHESYNNRFFDYGVYSVHSNVVPTTTTSWTTSWNTSRSTEWTTSWSSSRTTSWTTSIGTSRDTSHTTNWTSSYTTSWATSRGTSRSTDITTSWSTSKTTSWDSSRTTSYTTSWTGSKQTSRTESKTTSWTTTWSGSRSTSRTESKTTSYTTSWGVSRGTSRSTTKSYSRSTNKSTSWTTSWTGYEDRSRSTSRSTNKSTSKTTSRYTNSGGGGGGLPACISHDTEVEMLDGTTKVAGDLKIGDVVLAAKFDGMLDADQDSEWRDWKTCSISSGRSTYGRIVDIVKGEYRSVHLINGTLKITIMHEIFARKNGVWGWYDVRDLEVGDYLYGKDFKAVRIDTIERIDGKHKLVNFDVESIDVYFAGGFLVHNLERVTVIKP